MELIAIFWAESDQGEEVELEHFFAGLWLCSEPVMHFCERRKKHLKIYEYIPAFSPPLYPFIKLR